MAGTAKGKAAARWKFVYIAEAHAMDEWPVLSGRFNRGHGPVIVDEQPTKASDRCALARRFTHEFDMKLDGADYEVVVDDPEKGEPFEKAYAPWPLRLYLVRGDVIEWIAEPRACSYDDAVAELLQMLNLD